MSYLQCLGLMLCGISSFIMFVNCGYLALFMGAVGQIGIALIARGEKDVEPEEMGK